MSLLPNTSFTAVLRVAEKHFIADAAIMDRMVQLQRKKEKGEKKRGKARATRADGGGGGGGGGDPYVERNSSR